MEPLKLLSTGAAAGFTWNIESHPLLSWIISKLHLQMAAIVIAKANFELCPFKLPSISLFRKHGSGGCLFASRMLNVDDGGPPFNFHRNSNLTVYVSDDGYLVEVDSYESLQHWVVAGCPQLGRGCCWHHPLAVEAAQSPRYHRRQFSFFTNTRGWETWENLSLSSKLQAGSQIQD